MLLSNYIAGLCDHQYLQKESISILDFFTYRGKKSSESATFSWEWLDMSRNAHTCQDLLEVLLGDLRDIDRLKVVQNEMLIKFLGSSSVSCFNTILNN